MSARVKILDANEDNFIFERAFVAEQSGVPVPRAIMGGVLCNIETKPGPLADGLAFCEPVNPELAQDWPFFVDVDRGTGPERLWNITRNPRVVAAARRFAELSATGQARIGEPL